MWNLGIKIFLLLEFLSTEKPLSFWLHSKLYNSFILLKRNIILLHLDSILTPKPPIRALTVLPHAPRVFHIYIVLLRYLSSCSSQVLCAAPLHFIKKLAIIGIGISTPPSHSKHHPSLYCHPILKSVNCWSPHLLGNHPNCIGFLRAPLKIGFFSEPQKY